MFSKSLFKQSVKANWKVWTVVTVIMSMLVAQFCAMEKGIMDLTTVVFYGMMSIIIPTLYVVICANGLLAKQVDDGSMAYVLSSPIKRSSIVITQTVYLLGSLFVTFLSTAIVHLLLKFIVGSNSLGYAQIVYLNLASFGAVAAISGFCFMFSGIFNRSKNSIGASGMIAVFFILMSMMAMFGGLGADDSPMAVLDYFKYFTITTLCDNASILAGSGAWIWKLCVLLGLTGALYSVGVVWFCKKDLPL